MKFEIHKDGFGEEYVETDKLCMKFQCGNNNCVRFHKKEYHKLTDIIQTGDPKCGACGMQMESQLKVYVPSARDILGEPVFYEYLSHIIGDDCLAMPGLVYQGVYYIYFTAVDGKVQYGLILDREEFVSENLSELEEKLAEFARDN